VYSSGVRLAYEQVQPPPLPRTSTIKYGVLRSLPRLAAMMLSIAGLYCH
jgi:hypothetical protein